MTRKTAAVVVLAAAGFAAGACGGTTASHPHPHPRPSASWYVVETNGSFAVVQRTSAPVNAVQGYRTMAGADAGLEQFAASNPAPSSPSCDVTGWEGGNGLPAVVRGGDAVVPDGVESAMSSLRHATSTGDEAAAATAGHQLFKASVAALHHHMPPRCARKLRSDEKGMLVSFGAAGGALYLSGLDPAKQSSLYSLAGRDLKKAVRYAHKAAADASALGG